MSTDYFTEQYEAQVSLCEYEAYGEESSDADVDYQEGTLGVVF